MNILVLCYEYPPVGGGGGVGAQQYAEAWVAAGHRVRVITSHYRGLAKHETRRGVDIIRVTTLGRSDRATTPFLAMATFNIGAVLHSLLRRRQYRDVDVINTHFAVPTGPAAWFISNWLRRPNALTIIGGDIYDPSKKSSPHRSRVLRGVIRFLLRNANTIIAISSDTRRRALEHYDDSFDIQVINYGFNPLYNSADHNEVCNVRTDGFGSFCLITVGRLVERKGLDHLISAMTSLPDEIHLIIIGDGPLERRLKDLASSLNVEDRVHLLGYCSRAEIAAYLNIADCFVLASLHEGLGIVVQEAMHAGLPIVATNNGGQVDLIQEPRNGLLVEPANPEALSEAISRIYADLDMARQMGEHNREDIKELHIDENCKLYIDAFSQMLAARAKQP